MRYQATSRMLMAEGGQKIAKVLAGVAAIASKHNGPVAFGLIAIYGKPEDDKTEMLRTIEAVLPEMDALDDAPAAAQSQDSAQPATQGVLNLE